LYLFVEKNHTGRQVQQAHVQMAKKTKQYVKISLPENRGSITVNQVLAAAPGAYRDDMIRQWCIAVWATFSNEHGKVISLTEALLAK
jgi:hypothetical protein